MEDLYLQIWNCLAVHAEKSALVAGRRSGPGAPCAPQFATHVPDLDGAPERKSSSYVKKIATKLLYELLRDIAQQLYKGGLTSCTRTFPSASRWHGGAQHSSAECRSGRSAKSKVTYRGRLASALARIDPGGLLKLTQRLVSARSLPMRAEACWETEPNRSGIRGPSPLPGRNPDRRTLVMPPTSLGFSS
jgi:hypothetical protein